MTFHPTTFPYDAVESPWAPVEQPDALLVYAHPDDEILFAGGLMLAYPDWRWSLVRCVHGGNERAVDHSRAVELLCRAGVNIRNTYCLYAGDDWVDAAERRDWYRMLAEAVGVCFPPPDVVFTHGFRGEYGHPHHIAVHHIVHTLFDNVWDFYNVCGRVNEPQLIRGRVHVVPTDERKLDIMRQAYPAMLEALGSADPDLVAAQLSGRPEYFTR